MTIYYKIIITSFFFLSVISCKEVLEPTPINVLSTDLVLTEPGDADQVRIGLYNALRGAASAKVIAGDFTADMLTFQGTYTQYLEFGNKQITASNSAVGTLWAGIYNAIYVANFIIERLPALQGVSSAKKTEILAEAHFIRGYAYFIAAYSFGGVPLVQITDVDVNRNIARSSKEDVLKLALEDYQYALNKLPKDQISAAFSSDWAVRAALARYYLYQGQWAQAETYASEVIVSGKFTLTSTYSDLVTKDFTSEAILEMGYSTTDDPGSSSTSLNDLFVTRREAVPSNQTLSSLYSNESGERNTAVKFNILNLKGSDNGWSVAKYGTALEDNNNIVLFRLGEMYLIRAEARAQQSKVTGANSAEEDINVLRTRAKAPLTTVGSQAGMLLEIERERLYELAFEGHRWYDLVRTGRITAVMTAFSPNWKSTYERLPIPINEIQNNPSIAKDQNPGY